MDGLCVKSDGGRHLQLPAQPVSKRFGMFKLQRIVQQRFWIYIGYI